MKLQNQLNIAFTTLLIIIMTITGYAIYSLILDMLIQDEERQLEQKGELLVNILNSDSTDIQNTNKLTEFFEEQGLQVFLYNRKENSILFSTESERITKGFIKQNDFSNNKKGLWEYGKHKFVTSRILFYPKDSGLELVLITPLNTLQNVQHSFIMRMLIVLLIGSIVATILSSIFTKKLVTPLSKLKRQLKKVERRQFSDLERIKATGEIKEVEESVYEMANELNQYISAQQVFFQNASHELKTPLMTIQGYAEGVRDHVFTGEEAEKGLEVIVNEVARLKKNINEMTLLAKLDSMEQEFADEPVSVQTLVEAAIDRIKPIAKEKNIMIEQHIEADFNIKGSYEKLLQAMLNICSNAVRYATKTISITANSDKEYVQIMIEDDGDGIPSDISPYIFHRFVKGNDGETGLGLAISRALIEQSKGQVKADDSVLGGARFTIKFPREK